MHRFTALFAALFVVLAPVAVPVAWALARTATAQADEVDWKVLGHHCDSRGGIDGLRLSVPIGGDVTVRWDNAKICGLPV